MLTRWQEGAWGSRHWLVLVVIACALGVTGHRAVSAAQAPRAARIVLVSVDGTVERAVRNALAGWGLEVIARDEGAAGATLPRAAHDAAAIATAEGASIVAWISAADGHALWVYDADRETILARPLSLTLPIDGPAAAAIALTMKTLLRNSSVAPRAPPTVDRAPLVRREPLGSTSRRFG